MPTVSFTHTEINPSHSEGSGGGRRSHTLTEQNPTPTVGSGGGRRIFLETELPPTYVVGAGGGRRSFVLVEITPILTLPKPIVTTSPATGIGQVSATLNGFLDDDGGVVTDCWFEWGLDTTYGTETTPEYKSSGESFAFELHDLVPGTTYHFRAVARNCFGVSYGADEEFSTNIQINRAHALSREEL